MKVLLIDADSTIPNIALMKLSTYYKSKGNTVHFTKLNIPYYPNRKRQVHWIDNSEYDRTYCSVVFENSIDCIKGEGIRYGGTGYSLSLKLSDKVEQCDSDYSLYPDNNISYGFITRGCSRNCYFCKVPEKEGKVKQVNTIDAIIKHKKVKFLDNNILSHPDHLSFLQKLSDIQLRCQFTQGLDIRLVTPESSQLLSEMNYMGEYTFAFDHIKYKDIIVKKLELMPWRKPWQLRFFIYVHPDMPIKDTTDRLLFLKENNILAYVMRDLSCWSAVYNNFYIDIAAWANQPGYFKNFTFPDFLKKRYKNEIRIQECTDIWEKYNDRR